MKKNWTDQELQDLFENDPRAFADLARTNEDAQLYGLLFATFPRLDTPEVPAYFSERVLAQLEMKAAKAKKGYNLLLAGSVGVAILAGLTLSWLLSPEMVKTFQQLSTYLPFVAVAVLVFLGLELLDQKLIWGKADDRLLE